jgi:monoamine oxidase
VSDTDLLIIGAGAAGIAAARKAIAAGLSVRILEARPRIGGRAVTDARLGPPFDLGATWLHWAERNPLVPLARQLGIPLVNADARRNERNFIGTRPITEAENAAYDAAIAAFDQAVAAYEGPDIAVSEVVPRGGPWDATVAAWQGPVIAAWSLETMGVADFRANLLQGANLLPEGGTGSLLARLGAGLPVTLEAAVTRLAWGGREAVAEGAFGRLTARAVVCTLPSALLAAEAIRFDPPLPARVLEAAHALPLGAAIKVALKAAGADRLGLPPNTSTDRQVAPGEPLIPIQFWSGGHDLATGWIGGPLAVEIEREGPAAAEALLRAEIAARLGHAAPRAFRPGALVSAWSRDPFSRGAYSHGRIGCGEARAVIAAPLAGGRLCLAGEAADTSGLAATLAGAWNSGEAAAAAVIAALA